MTSEQEWGLAAYGRSGQFEVEVSDTCVGDDELLAVRIGTRPWDVSFSIPERGIVAALAAFLAGAGGHSIIAGSFYGAPVEVRRDPEFADRFFIIVGEGFARIEFIVAGQSDVSDFSSALLQAVEDLK